MEEKIEEEIIIHAPIQLIMEEYNINIINTSQNDSYNEYKNENSKINKYNLYPAILYYLCAYMHSFYIKKNSN